jgi:hypothetical protein
MQIDIDRLNIGLHSISKLAQRLAIDPVTAMLKARDYLRTAQQISFEEAASMFPITKRRNTDIYLRFYEERIKEHVLAIIADQKQVVTFLTENIHATPYDTQVTRSSVNKKRRMNPRIMPDGGKGSLR